jgi:predicted O-methyltransferase YrrM
MRPMFEAAKKLYGVNPVVGVEVGTSAGSNAVEVCTEWQELQKLYCVDSYPTYADFNTVLAQTTLLFCCIGNLIASPKTHLILESSVTAAKDFLDGYLDFVYIDANHSYASVKEDILAWLPKIKKGGIIGGHDLDWKDSEQSSEYAVLKAVKEIFGDRMCHHPNLFTSESISTDEKGYYTGTNSDWWVLL